MSGGFFDSHKAGKSLRLVNALWALNLMQFIFVLISPSVFGVALYNGLKNGAQFSTSFDWAQYVVFDVGSQFGEIDVVVLVTGLYLLVYVLWSMNAFLVRVSFISLLSFPSFFFLLFIFSVISIILICVVIVGRKGS